MTMTISGSGSISGLVAGGLPNSVITQPELAANVAGNGPAFSAYASSGTVCSNGGSTKIVLNSEEFDTNNNFDSTTNYRFTPTVAGYYNVNGYVSCGSSSGCYITIFKSGSEFKRGTQTESASPQVGYIVTSQIYFNGTTDYAELYFGNFSGSSKTTNSGSSFTYFQAAMVRSA